MPHHLSRLGQALSLLWLSLATCACTPARHVYSEYYDPTPKGFSLRGESIEILIRRSTVSVSPRVRTLMGWSSPSGSPAPEDLMLGYACDVLAERVAHYADSNQVTCAAGREPAMQYQPITSREADFLQQAWPVPDDERPHVVRSGARYTIIVDALTLAASSEVAQIDTQGVAISYGIATASRQRVTVSRKLELSLSARFVIWNNKSRSSSALGRVEASTRLHTDERWDALRWLFDRVTRKLLNFSDANQSGPQHDYSAKARSLR